MGFPCCLLPPSLAPAFLSSTSERMKWCGEGPFRAGPLWSKGLCLPNSLSITLSTVTIHPVREALFWFPSAFFFFFTKCVCLPPTFHLCFHLHFPWPPLLEPCINRCNSLYPPPPPPPRNTLLHFSLSLLVPCLCWCNTWFTWYTSANKSCHPHALSSAVPLFLSNFACSLFSLRIQR